LMNNTRFHWITPRPSGIGRPSGTSGYLSPEAILSEHCTHKHLNHFGVGCATDMFGVGVLALILLSAGTDLEARNIQKMVHSDEVLDLLRASDDDDKERKTKRISILFPKGDEQIMTAVTQMLKELLAHLELVSSFRQTQIGSRALTCSERPILSTLVNWIKSCLSLSGSDRPSAFISLQQPPFSLLK